MMTEDELKRIEHDNLEGLEDPVMINPDIVVLTAEVRRLNAAYETMRVILDRSGVDDSGYITARLIEVFNLSAIAHTD